MPLVARLPIGEVQGELEGVEPGETSGGGFQILSKNTTLLCKLAAMRSALRSRRSDTFLKGGILKFSITQLQFRASNPFLNVHAKVLKCNNNRVNWIFYIEGIIELWS